MSKSMTETFKCNDVQLMGKLNEALHCIWELMREYRDKISQCNVMPSTIYHASFAYYPLLVDMHKDEALNIIYDMFKVTERIKFSLRWTQDIPLLNRSSRLLFTLSTYLCAVTSTNPEFFEKHRKLMNMWKINDRHH